MAKDKFCSYYTNSQEITSFMVNRLEIEPEDVVLEPCAGEGVFIDEIMRRCNQVAITALEMDEGSFIGLQKKYNNLSNVTVKATDTLLDAELDHAVAAGGRFSKIIGNPPYGAWQEPEKRELLKKKYSGHYVKETYSLFLLRCISLLKNAGRLSFIIPDTFLYLNMHKRLREILLTKTKIKEIVIFPSHFFPGISFGYSQLSIVTLEKCDLLDHALNNQIKVFSDLKNVSDLLTIDTITAEENSLFSMHMLQQDVLNNPKDQFFISDNNKSALLKQEKHTVLGDVADVVTGLYSGDNKKYIRCLSNNLHGAKQYSTISSDTIHDSCSLTGIEGVEEGYIPYIKRAPRKRYSMPPDTWFIRWDTSAIQNYIQNKKARFQNTNYYFRAGIGVPMVKSKTIKAFFMERRVFDQSIVGIFPHNNNKMYYILALMNSEVVNSLLHIINPTANNSANYIKQIPYIEPSEEIMKKINDLVSQCLCYTNCQREETASNSDYLHMQINDLIAETYNTVIQ